MNHQMHYRRLSSHEWDDSMCRIILELLSRNCNEQELYTARTVCACVVKCVYLLIADDRAYAILFIFLEPLLSVALLLLIMFFFHQLPLCFCTNFSEYHRLQ